MKNTLCLAFALAACSSSNSAPAPSTGSGAAPTPTIVEKPAADRDPSFVHVDRDQLAAVCLAGRLPRTTPMPVHGALTLADGERLGWLVVSSYEELDPVRGERVVLADAWLTEAKETLRDLVESEAGNARPRPRDGKSWLHVPCDYAEATRVVVTGVFVQPKTVELVALHGTKALTRSLPKGATKETIHATAFALLEELVGQQASIATHVGEGTQPFSTVQDASWTAAAAN